MKARMFVLSLAAGLLASTSHAANIYMFSSGDPSLDATVSSVLTSRGHTVTTGQQYWQYDGTMPLAGFDTVYLQANNNWTAGPMSAGGQTQLVNWVRAGGRLVTSEWVVFFSGEPYNFPILGQVIPTEAATVFGYPATVTLSRQTPNQSINAGVPTSFTCPLNNYAGTETFTVAKFGASTYYISSNSVSGAGLCGWRIGLGYSYSFSTTCGADQVTDPNFAQLFSNVMSATSPACETSDFNGDGDAGTDADIEAFFACLGGNCCPACPGDADFNGDGDTGTDADIESFFRVLSGGNC